ncbi:hypothetical protein Tco_0629770 [Tanacetum coccineum]|uniref:Uncharacterized protein n=1 Tax=Tanacetum coccineum TaxID=301880 RepID=A0ABQ4WUC8_9ASTR
MEYFDLWDSCMIKFLKPPKNGNQLRFLIHRVPSGRTSNALSIPHKVMTNDLTRSGLIRSFQLKASAMTFAFSGCSGISVGAKSLGCWATGVVWKLIQFGIYCETGVVSSVIGGILSIEARDMDTKLLSAPESNNTLARYWFRWNVPVTMFGSWHEKLLTLAAGCFQWLALCFCSSWSDDPPSSSKFEALKQVNVTSVTLGNPLE